jgi:hypothetical protein
VKKLESIAAVCCDSRHTGNLHLVNGHFLYSVGDFVSRCGGLCSVEDYGENYTELWCVMNHSCIGKIFIV